MVLGEKTQIDKNNSLKIVWFTAGTAGTPGIYLAESEDGGKSFLPRQLISNKGASGTPIIMSDAAGNTQIIFSAVDKNTYLLATQNASADFVEQSKIADADLPGVTTAKGKVFFTFFRKVNDKRMIFLSSKN